LAKSTEAQSDGDTAKSIEGYAALLNQFPKSIYKAAAEERIESLKSPEAKEFYAWFHKQNPKPADLKKPKDGLPEGHPPIDSLPDNKPDGEKTKSEDQTKSSEVESPVVAKLKAEIEVDWKKMPLQDAVKSIAEKCEIEIDLDGEALKASGFTKDMEQNLTLGKGTGLAAIDAILQKSEKERPGRGMVLVIRDEEKKALITTAEFAKKNEQTPFEFSKPADADPPKLEAPKQDTPKSEPAKDEKPKSDDKPTESKDKDAPAESK